MLRKGVKNYKAKDVMTRNVISLPPHETLLKAHSTMSQRRIKKIVVSEEGAPVAIITAKDIIRFVISDQTDREMHEIDISEAMSKRLITAVKDSGIVECSQIMSRNNVSSIVIVESLQHSGKRSKISGIITSSDLTNFFAERCAGIATVKDCMSSPVLTIQVNEKVSRAAKLMIEKDISHLIVTGPDNLLRGILSEIDLLLLMLAFKSATLKSVYENNLILFHSSTRRNLVEPALATIKDVFTPNPTTIQKNADSAEAAKVMVRQGISALPVVDSLGVGDDEGDSNGRPVGIITKSDIVKVLAQSKLNNLIFSSP